MAEYDELIKALRAGYCYYTLLEEAADAIEELSVVLESYRKRMREGCDWTPVKDQHPKEGSDLLVYTDEGWMFKAQYLGTMGGEEVFDDYEGSGWEGAITHWMPLPEPPKEPGNG